MKSVSRLICMTLILVSAWSPLAAQSPVDPLHANLFPPELLIRHREKIGLSEEQVKKIHSLMQQAGPKVQKRQHQLNGAMKKMAKLLNAEKVDEEAVIARLDQMLAVEKELKHIHFRVMIQFRNMLSSDQRKVATKIRQHIQHANGSKRQIRAKPDESKSSRVNTAKRKSLSFDKMKAEVAALKKENVAWRKIAWKTCLIDGLKASREQNKPVMLWIFIDRPIDDERC